MTILKFVFVFTIFIQILGQSTWDDPFETEVEVSTRNHVAIFEVSENCTKQCFDGFYNAYVILENEARAIKDKSVHTQFYFGITNTVLVSPYHTNVSEILGNNTVRSIFLKHFLI